MQKGLFTTIGMVLKLFGVSETVAAWPKCDYVTSSVVAEGGWSVLVA